MGRSHSWTTKRSGAVRFAVIVGVVGLTVLSLLTGPAPAGYLQAAGMLCLGWVIAFVPAPRHAHTVRGVYTASRTGWRMTWGGKIMTLLGLVLVAVGAYLQYR